MGKALIYYIFSIQKTTTRLFFVFLLYCAIIIVMKGKIRNKIIYKAKMSAKFDLKNTDNSFNFNQNNDVDDCLDLHGYTRKEALSILDDFINFSLDNNFSKVRIITGIGEDNYSVLKGVLLEYLSDKNIKFSQSSQNRGGNGAFDIYL